VAGRSNRWNVFVPFAGEARPPRGGGRGGGDVRFGVWGAGACALASFLLVPAGATAQGPPAASAETRPASGFNGDMRWVYRLRWNSDTRDQDLFSDLALRYGREGEGPVDASFFGRLSADLDGRRDEAGYYVFDGVTDTWRGNLQGRIYHAYLDVNRPFRGGGAWLDRFRVGRQFVEEAEGAYFDGVRLDLAAFPRLWGLKAAVYGGMPSHPYESSRAGDAMAGAAAEISPHPRLRFRGDYTRIRDNRNDFFFGDQEDDLVTAQGWWRATDRIRLHGAVSMLTGLARDVRGDALWTDPERDASVRLFYRRQFRTLRDQAGGFDLFSATARTFFPYHDGSVAFSKGFGRHLLLEGAAQWRALADAEDEGRYNHGFSRVSLTPSVNDWPVDGFSFGVTGEQWNATGGEDVATGGFDVRYLLTRAVRLGAGSYYSLFRYDPFTGDERDDVRTAYVEARWKVREDLRLDLWGEFEDDDFDAYNLVRASLTWSF
jgi:hypothetical protein